MQLVWLLLMPFYLWGITITEDTTLEDDVVYNEDVVIEGAVLNLNYHTMTINGDLNITGASARLQMNKSNDKLIITGDLTFAGASTYNYLTNGVIELAGNFYQEGSRTSYDCGWRCSESGLNSNSQHKTNNAYSFYPTENHKLILNGTSEQRVVFDAPNSSRFNHLEIQNSSNEGVLFEQLNVVGTWNRNNKNVIITDIRNLTLTEDYTISNSLEVIGGILNLNGHTLTVNGDLNITGNYARLQMSKNIDKLIVTGDLVFAGASTYQDLTNGVIELAGNFYQKGTSTSYSCGWRCSESGLSSDSRYSTNNAYSFYPTENHKLILNGTSEQRVVFDAPNSSRFNHLEIQNSSNEGVLFEQLNVVGTWNRNNKNVIITDIRNLTLTEDYTISNSLEVIGGILNLNGHTLTINGNLKFSNSYCRLQMKKANDKLIVIGDLTFAGASTYQDLTNGMIELAGNFYQKGISTSYSCGWRCSESGLNSDSRYNTNNAYSFYPTENHKLILNGISEQRVVFEALDYSRFMNLEIANDNVVFPLDVGKKVKVINNLYLDDSLYNSTYKDNEFITYAHYRDIYSTYMTIPRGLNLIALPIKQTINESQIASIFSDENISHVLKYDSTSKKWQGFGNSELAKKKITNINVAKLTSIKAGEGFFVKAEGEVDLKFPKDDGYDFYSNIDTLSSGWHLLGTNKLIDLNELLRKKENIKIIRKYKEGKYRYLSNDSDIEDEFRHMNVSKIEDTNITNSGFWVYVE